MYLSRNWDVIVDIPEELMIEDGVMVCKHKLSMLADKCTYRVMVSEDESGPYVVLMIHFDEGKDYTFINNVFPGALIEMVPDYMNLVDDESNYSNRRLS